MQETIYIESVRKVSDQRDTEDDQIGLFARFRGRTRAYCPKCRRPVQLMSDSRAEDLFKSELPELLSLATRGLLHRLHNSKGLLMFCGDSLFQCFSDRPTQMLSGTSAQHIFDIAKHAR